jgi:hypothetical protein
MQIAAMILERQRSLDCPSQGDRKMMKTALLTSAVLIAGSAFVAQPATAAQKWCAVMNLGDLAENCHFVSRQQCQASLTGNSDFCRPSYYPEDRRRR